MKPLSLCLIASLIVSCATLPQMSESSPADAGLSSAEDGGYLGDLAAQLMGKKPEALVAPAEKPAEPAPAGERAVIYSAALRLVVVSARETFAAIQGLAREAGGHLQESDARSITIRVPAARFDEVVASIAGLGEVVDRTVKAADVTEELLDLGIRLDNAKKARERLLAHLEKSDKMEDTLAIERELARVTGEIEQMEGRLRFMQAQIAMSTIRVELNASVAQRPSDGVAIPFEWIARLGDGLLAGTVQSMPRKPRIFSSGPDFDPPADFVRYYSKGDLVEALSAEGLRLKVQEQENYDEGALAFWRQLARNALVRTRSLAVTEERELGPDRTLLAGTRDVGGEAYGYLLVLVRTKKHVYTFEAWGPEVSFAHATAALVESAKTLEK